MSQLCSPATLPDTLTPRPSFSFPSQSQESEVWGRLITRRSFLRGLDVVDLMKQSYNLGRKDTCDICLTGNNMNPNYLGLISKIHFVIYRNINNVPCIDDLSKNGTYVNGRIIGLNKTEQLRDGDIISIGGSQLQVFMFKDDWLLLGKKYRVTERVLGKGSFGEVILIFSKRNCKRFAAKKIAIDNSQARVMVREVNILQTLEHPCVIHMEEVIYGVTSAYIILDYMEGGDLQRRIPRKCPLPEELAKLYFYQLLKAVQYLHSQNITHRDLKPENVLLATTSQKTLLKVTDFGLSKAVCEASGLKTAVGTPLYTAPEVLKSRMLGNYTPLVDIWSLGCVLYYTLFGETPFRFDMTKKRDCEQDLFCHILRGQYVIPNSKNVSDEAKDLIKKILVVNPNKRICSEMIMGHKWIKEDLSTLHDTLEDLIAQFNNSP